MSSGGGQVLGGRGDLLSLGLSALALRMYFGVSDRLHLLSQKQRWSRPRELRPQDTRILNLHPRSSPLAGVLAQRGRQRAGAGAQTVVTWPLGLERPAFFGIWGEGVAEDKIIQGTEKKPEKQVLWGTL